MQKLVLRLGGVCAESRLLACPCIALPIPVQSGQQWRLHNVKDEPRERDYSRAGQQQGSGGATGMLFCTSTRFDDLLSLHSPTSPLRIDFSHSQRGLRSPYIKSVDLA